MRKIAILQARMSSTRLPGKVLLDLAGKPVLQRMLERVRLAKTLDGIVLATTTDPSDDVLTQFCQSQNIPCYRGSLQDVLDRYYAAALRWDADVIVRLTGDCPLLDPELLDLTVQAFLGEFLTPPASSSQLTDHSSLSAFPFDYATDRLPPPWNRSLPIGLDVEVCSFDALQHAWTDAHEIYQREHVMPFLYEGVTFTGTTSTPDSPFSLQHGISPRGFRVALLNHAPDYGSLRWTVDTPADLEFVRQVFLRLDDQPDFSWRDVLALLEKEPALADINAEIRHKSAYDVDEQQAHPKA